MSAYSWGIEISRITMGNSYSIYRFRYHIFSDNTDYQLITKGILYDIPIGEKIFLVWNEYTYFKMKLYFNFNTIFLLS